MIFYRMKPWPFLVFAAWYFDDLQVGYQLNELYARSNNL